MCSHYTQKQIRNFWKKVEKTDSCWLWNAAKGRGGYGHFNIGGKLHYAHRMSWELVNGDIPDGLQVLHNCPDRDNPSCVNPAHLSLGTLAENIRDRDQKAISGKHSSRLRKLTQEQVDAIRALYSTGEYTLKQLGKTYSVCEATISLIVHRKRWA